jgi:sodium/bile acid cotransporter 7
MVESVRNDIILDQEMTIEESLTNKEEEEQEQAEEQQQQLSVSTSSSSTSLKNKTSPRTIRSTLQNFANKNFVMLGMVSAVLVAKAFPALGKDGGFFLADQLFGKSGVTAIFLLSGLSLAMSELRTAMSNIKLNAMIQLLIFAAWPMAIGIPMKVLSLLQVQSVQHHHHPLMDGILILSCLPTTINMCIILTSSGNGNVALSICSAVLSNMLGILISPALLFYFFGTEIQLPFLPMVLKLCKQVLVPVGIGQALRMTKAKDIYNNHADKFKRIQEILLLGIVWNAFCNAFTQGLGLQLKHGMMLLGLLPMLHLSSWFAMFQLFSLPFWKISRPDVVAATFCASQKTLAFGLPLINTVFQGSPNLAAYCAPLMFLFPLQMTFGSLLLPKVKEYVANGNANGDANATAIAKQEDQKNHSSSSRLATTQSS